MFEQQPKNKVEISLSRELRDYPVQLRILIFAFIELLTTAGVEVDIVTPAQTVEDQKNEEPISGRISAKSLEGIYLDKKRKNWVVEMPPDFIPKEITFSSYMEALALVSAEIGGSSAAKQRRVTNVGRMVKGFFAEYLEKDEDGRLHFTEEGVQKTVECLIRFQLDWNPIPNMGPQYTFLALVSFFEACRQDKSIL
jgi:hypothetical protein